MMKFAFLLNNHDAASKLTVSLWKDSVSADLKGTPAYSPVEYGREGNVAVNFLTLILSGEVV